MAIRDLENKKTTASNYAKDLIMDKIIPLLKGYWMENPYLAKNMTAKELGRIQTQLDKHICRVAKIFHYEDPTENNCLLVRLSEKMIKEIAKRDKKAEEKKAEKTESTKESIDKMKEKAKIKKKVSGTRKQSEARTHRAKTSKSKKVTVNILSKDVKKAKTKKKPVTKPKKSMAKKKFMARKVTPKKKKAKKTKKGEAKK